MQKSTKIHFVIVPISFVVSTMSEFLQKPFETVFMVLFMVSFALCSLVGLSAAIRNKNFLHLFHPNPIKQIRASASTYLNGVEKLIDLCNCYFNRLLSGDDFCASDWTNITEIDYDISLVWDGEDHAARQPSVKGLVYGCPRE